MIEILSAEGKSLLLYFETRMVDGSGLVEGARMNDDDIKLASEWDSRGYVSFGRLKIREIEAHKKNRGRIFPTHYIRLSANAWDAAHQLRRERSARMIDRDEKLHGIPEKLVPEWAPK